MADSATTDHPRLACAVMVADCLPVLFTNSTGSVVAAIHAGWRRLARGVLDRAIDKFRQCAQVQEPQNTAAEHVLACLEPCIGPTQFEVG